ncbi:SIR2-like domain protein [Entomobacter blattae]|uniref:SIR2-like domain protein n=2 Tax=Entomobacter blattae TaxID=2762277 RepID=A0A7H1NS54_9PROT|nr:SIR2-like domain protein [Entomobacter blattae]
MPAGLPDFKKLVKFIYKDLGEHINSSLNRLEKTSFNNNEFDRTLFYLKQRLAGANQKIDNHIHYTKLIIESIEKNFKAKLRKNRNLRNHEVLLSLSEDSSGECRIVTTNFDTLFEEAKDGKIESHAGAGMPLPGSPKFKGAMHLHGRLKDERNELKDTELVLFSSDFGEAYARAGWATRFVYELMQAYTVVIIGYSLNDPPVRYLLEALAIDSQRFPFKNKVYFITSSKGGESNDDYKRLESMNITPIIFDGWDLAYKTLEEWSCYKNNPENWVKKKLEEVTKDKIPNYDDNKRKEWVKQIFSHKEIERLLPSHLFSKEWIDYLFYNVFIPDYYNINIVPFIIENRNNPLVIDIIKKIGLIKLDKFLSKYGGADILSVIDNLFRLIYNNNLEETHKKDWEIIFYKYSLYKKLLIRDKYELVKRIKTGFYSCIDVEQVSLWLYITAIQLSDVLDISNTIPLNQIEILSDTSATEDLFYQLDARFREYVWYGKLTDKTEIFLHFINEKDIDSQNCLYWILIGCWKQFAVQSPEKAKHDVQKWLLEDDRLYFLAATHAISESNNLFTAKEVYSAIEHRKDDFWICSRYKLIDVFKKFWSEFSANQKDLIIHRICGWEDEKDSYWFLRGFKGHGLEMSPEGMEKFKEIENNNLGWAKEAMPQNSGSISVKVLPTRIAGKNKTVLEFVSTVSDLIKRVDGINDDERYNKLIDEALDYFQVINERKVINGTVFSLSLDFLKKLLNISCRNEEKLLCFFQNIIDIKKMPLVFRWDEGKSFIELWNSLSEIVFKNRDRSLENLTINTALNTLEGMLVQLLFSVLSTEQKKQLNQGKLAWDKLKDLFLKCVGFIKKGSNNSKSTLYILGKDMGYIYSFDPVWYQENIDGLFLSSEYYPYLLRAYLTHYSIGSSDFFSLLWGRIDHDVNSLDFLEHNEKDKYLWKLLQVLIFYYEKKNFNLDNVFQKEIEGKVRVLLKASEVYRKTFIRFINNMSVVPSFSNVEQSWNDFYKPLFSLWPKDDKFQDGVSSGCILKIILLSRKKFLDVYNTLRGLLRPLLILNIYLSTVEAETFEYAKKHYGKELLDIFNVVYEKGAISISLDLNKLLDDLIKYNPLLEDETDYKRLRKIING